MQDWDSLMAEIERQEAERADMRRAFGWEDAPVSAPPQSPARQEKRSPARARKSDGAEIVSFAPSVSAGERASRDETSAAATLPFAMENKGWNASELILEEKKDALGEEDVQCYLIRKRFTGIGPDDELERMERLREPPVPAWEDSASARSREELYLRIEKHLSDARSMDRAEEEMLRLSSTADGTLPEMDAFYQAFTLLQNNPSGQKLNEVQRRLNALPGGTAGGEGTLVLRRAIAALSQARWEQNAQQHQRYAERQSDLERQQRQAQRDYDAAQHKADRWRK